MRIALGSCLLVVAQSLAACAGPTAPGSKGSPPRPGPTPRQQADPPAGGSEFSGAPRTARSKRQLVSLELPSGNEWSLDDQGPAWWIATHGPTSSELAVRTWRAARTVSTADCLAEARLRGPRHFQEPAEVLDSRALAAPEGFTGEVVLGVTDAGGHLEGRLQAVGRTAGRCFALGFVTVAEGPRAPALVGGRLAAIAEVVAPSVRILGPDDRVE